MTFRPLWLWSLAFLSLVLSSHAQVPLRKAQAILYVDRVPTPQELAQRHTRALYEPAVGCYTGAFIDFDASLKRQYRDMNRTPHRDPAEFEAIVQRPHSMYFFYMGYGRRVPMDWLQFLARRNKFVHIALEPNKGLNHVRDDRYLREIADDMGRSGAKIFLRFASEMNGPWTNYSKSPKQYREKYRLLYQVMKRRAPNVALVWCPFAIPLNTIDSYYPGDDATDWVGLNLYSVTYHNNDKSEPAQHEHPADLLAPVYNKYAKRKPFMICEFAATHFAAVEGFPRTEFAARKILTLYHALPRLFPRVKCINYFDSNNIAFVSTRAYNNYSVTDDPEVIAAYRASVAAPYFLPAPVSEPQPAPPPVPMPIRPGEPLRGSVTLSCWARVPSDILQVRYRLDGRLIHQADFPDKWQFVWNSGSVAPGRHKLTLEALNSARKIVARQSVFVEVRR